ncbi:MAG: hypothetical protein O3A37_00500 [Planctomycetota bacterium]|jgi:hypothetical protein|nr:hypothetical protein [Planctomycetota bacterium]
MHANLFRTWLYLAAIVATVQAAGGLARGEDPVAVLVTGPLAGTIGERVSFEVEIVNRSGQPLQKLRIVDYFDSGFHHEASKSPIEQTGTIDLAAGTSRRLTLDFILDEPGRQCHRVEIIDQSQKFVGGATACVQVAAAPTATPVPQAPPIIAPPATPIAPPTGSAFTQPTTNTAAAPPVAAPMTTSAPLTATAPPATASATPSLELGLSGPNELTSGGTAEYVAVIRNTGTVATGETILDLSWDDGFSPLEASDGYVLGSSKVSWSLPSIQPGEELRRQLNLRAQAPPRSYRDTPPSRSCVRAVLGGVTGGMMVADESCVPIRSTTPRPRTPREAGIRVSLADLDDPVSLGGSTTLICTISNVGISPSGPLDLAITIPDQARLVGDPRPSRVRIDGLTISFDAVGSVPPGGHTSFELAYRMPAGGTGRATATLTGDELDGAVEAACATTFTGE